MTAINLAAIIQRRRESLELLPSIRSLKIDAASAEQSRGFAKSIKAKIADNKRAIIAEIKPASPSAGVIAQQVSAKDIATKYEQGGAAALSVLTEPDFFRGSVELLQQARASVALPVLRKDFIIDERQVYESRVMQADAILLIVAALEPAELRELHDLARSLGLDVLVEIHDESELEIALELDSELLGINNRNLKTLEVDTACAARIISQIPAQSGKILIAESGLKTINELSALQKLGCNCFLIGETLMRSQDPISKTQEFVG